jgi:hypothetical protein
MTIGPKPKPLRTGGTLHTVCITNGRFNTYKLFARVYGGKGDEDINVHNEHTAIKLKMVSLYDLMLDPFKGVGHCVIMDSASMGDAMCQQVGRAKWGINRIQAISVIRGARYGVFTNKKHALNTLKMVRLLRSDVMLS